MTLNWRTISRNGLLGGVVAFYLSAIGLAETFSQRFLIGTFFSTGQLFVTVGAIMAGILTANALKEQENDRTAYISSLLSGVVSSLPLLFLIFLIQILVVPQIGQEVVFRWRDMFINFSPVLVDLLTFDQGIALGVPLLILASTILAGLGAALILLPERWRVALLNAFAWTLGIGLFSENVTQILNQFGARIVIRFLFQAKSLNPLAAVLIFVGAFAVAYFRVHKSAQNRWAAMSTSQKKRGRNIGIVLGVILLLALPWMVGQFLSQALFLIGLYVMMGLGLNIVVGYAGLLDLGYVAFFAIGAYTMGIFTSTGELGISNLNFWTTLPIALLIGLMAGVILGFPVLRMRGDYLAIVTLGFGEIIRIVATSDWLAPFEGGPQGVLHIPNPTFFGELMEKPQEMYYLVVAGSLLIAFVTLRLKDSRLGRQWMAMREDEDVAEAMGINLVQTKLLAFSVGAGFSALAGAIFAARLGNIFPHSFNLIVSINALSLIIVGGMGSIPGVIVGSLILVGMPELLREFTEYRFLMYGILLIIMMLFKPEGFLPDVTHKRELQGEEEDLAEDDLATSEA
jgi:branched-chain amino acid transport system permease protein